MALSSVPFKLQWLLTRRGTNNGKKAQELRGAPGLFSYLPIASAMAAAILEHPPVGLNTAVTQLLILVAILALSPR